MSKRETAHHPNHRGGGVSCALAFCPPLSPPPAGELELCLCLSLHYLCLSLSVSLSRSLSRSLFVSLSRPSSLLSFLCLSFAWFDSKTHHNASPPSKVGWVLGPRRVIQEIHTILPYMQFCAATPLQEAMCTVLVDAEKPYEGSASYYDWLREQYAGKRHRLEKALAAAGIRSLKGEGGFFLIGDVSKIKV